MLAPLFGPRIEEPGDHAGLRIDARQIASLLQVAIGTCQAKVLQGIIAAVLAGNGVLHMKCD